MIKDLEFEDFISIYDEEIFCAYMETGSSYEMDYEDFEELEYEAYLQGHGQWAKNPPTRIDTDLKV